MTLADYASFCRLQILVCEHQFGLLILTRVMKAWKDIRLTMLHEKGHITWTMHESYHESSSHVRKNMRMIRISRMPQL